jgi:RNA recognition motif-containing protein
MNNGYEDDGLEAKKVLFVRHLDNPDLKITMIYNLFSNYGNIAKILFMKQKRQALVEFETVEQATVAKDYLNNLVYFAS